MAPISKHPWPQFHGDYRHTGQAFRAGPTQATLKWKYDVGAVNQNGPSSVVVDKNGQIYSTGDNKILALTPQGTLAWSKTFRSRVILASDPVFSP